LPVLIASPEISPSELVSRFTKPRGTGDQAISMKVSRALAATQGLANAHGRFVLFCAGNQFSPNLCSLHMSVGCLQ
jgi:hypothetical protein